MKRQDKYPDTSFFHYYNANPKNRQTTDCVIRAICTALELPYNSVVTEMAELQCKTGYDISSDEGIDKYLKGKGWIKHTQPRKADNTKYTGKEFCSFADINKNYIANIGSHHIVAIVKSKIHDTWDSTDGCIGNYWTKG